MSTRNSINEKTVLGKLFKDMKLVELQSKEGQISLEAIALQEWLTQLTSKVVETENDKPLMLI